MTSSGDFLIRRKRGNRNGWDGTFYTASQESIKPGSPGAERMRQNYIGTEHLLLGLMREEGGIAGRVLRELGLDAARMEEIIILLRLRVKQV
jgi:ATP-dependent Clp protease ATP-binding subunit ClpC